MKKTAIAFYFAGLLLVSFTLKASIKPGWTGNWYVGGSLGYADLNGDLNTTMNYTGNAIPGQFLQTLNVINYTDTGFVVGALVGYQEIWHQWLVGGELNFDLQSIDRNHTFAFSDIDNLIGWTGNARYQRKNMIGLSGRVGYAVSPYFMPFARLGVGFSDDKLITSFAGNPGVYPNEVVMTEQHWIHCFLLGAGAEIPIPHTCGATVRLEYNFYSRARTVQGFGLLLDGVISPTFQSGIQPEMQMIRMSLVWNFF
ncbi:MAG: outer membrane protein [Candidatus Berkiellales bacterium]